MKQPSLHINDMYEARAMFAVFLRRKDGSEFIASGSPLGPALFHNRKLAGTYKKELCTHNLRGVIRSVLVTIRPEEN